MSVIAVSRSLACLRAHLDWVELFGHSDSGGGQDKSCKVLAIGWGESVKDFNRPDQGPTSQQKVQTALSPRHCSPERTLWRPQ